MDSTLRRNLQEDRLVFIEIVPTLQAIAAFNVALPLYCGILHRLKSGDGLHNYNDEIGKLLESLKVEKQAKKYIKQLKVPQLIKDRIDKTFRQIEYEIYDWAQEIGFAVFNDDVPNLRLSHIKCLVWQSVRKIDYEKTARKILSHPGFTQVEKFNLMCEFCWKDEIEALVPGVELQRYMEDIFSAPNSLGRFATVHYWIRKLKNELHKIFYPDFDSLERFMLSQNLTSADSVEYFMSTLSEEDQITVVIELLTENEEIMSKQKSLLLKLNEFQRCSVISKIPRRIITNFMNSSDFEYAHLVWTRAENSMTDDEFVILVKNILKRIPQDNEEQFPFMAELWNEASDQHKNYCLYGRGDIIDLFFNQKSKIERDVCLPFLSAILSYASAKYRRNIILKRGDVLLDEYFPHEEVIELINFCLPSSSDMAKFKIRVQKSTFLKKRYAELFRQSAFIKLFHYLESYFSEEPVLKDLMRQIIDENDFNFDYFIFGEFGLDLLLNMVYNNDEAAVKNITKKIILSFTWSDNYELSYDNLRRWRDAIELLMDDMPRPVQTYDESDESPMEED